MTTFWKQCERYSPILVRLLARHPHGKPLTDEEIAVRSGNTLTPLQVADLSQRATWGSVDVLTMRRYLTACGVDFCNRKQMKRIDAYLRSKPNFKYLRTSPAWNSFYLPLMLRWKESLHGNQH